MDQSTPPVQPLNARQFLILLALHDGPQHGYGILKTVEAESNGDVRFDPANLYRTLKLLHRDGLVEELPARGDDEDRRRVFALTTRGHVVLRTEAGRVSRLAQTARAKNLVPNAEPTR